MFQPSFHPQMDSLRQIQYIDSVDAKILKGCGVPNSPFEKEMTKITLNAQRAIKEIDGKSEWFWVIT